ncbi:hypothetical protein Val02_60270 [Virgisporangium aliadipatigenens]|uniref:Uncharacterized protein n=1 Tax=Virgisporangium aliadipatigenens TaxID=741659 RepID=A0A8J3YPR0_9ACTN|nr:hypothetical protein [Virgisporangium aliadipatigenens]GIJ49141.1 hypothetical protein Val02_60270 [Virgisporangium aliadipatigenens]
MAAADATGGQIVGSYNLLQAELQCPHCDERAACEVEFRLGLLDLRTYRLGEPLRWAGGRRDKPLRCPDRGDATGAGYTVCPVCERDFWVRLDVVGDRIVTAVPDPDRSGYLT